MGGGEMKATINGVTVEGTPAEIAELTKLSQRGDGLAARIVPTPPARLGPPAVEIHRCPMPSGPEQERALRKLEDLFREIPNVNITPLGRVCTGHMRYC
jgi:hypothetical protein